MYIVRDIKNFRPEQLHKFFTILGQKKQPQGLAEINFPIIMETSDNLWMEQIHIGRVIVYPSYILNKIYFTFYQLKHFDPCTTFNGMKARRQALPYKVRADDLIVFTLDELIGK